ncbi:MAG: hypothetical protein M1536_07340 [Firmicutes bacterium]|nr:hypothetical protein [Bacillota bacterium]
MMELLGEADAQPRRFRKTLISRMKPGEQLGERDIAAKRKIKFVLRHDTPQQSCRVFDRKINKFVFSRYFMSVQPVILNS